MPIRLTCDNCDQPFEVDDASAGAKAECPRCGDVRRVPARKIEPSAADASAAAPKSGPRGAGVFGSLGENEEILATVRQAMFRAHPLLYTFFLLLILGGFVLAGLAMASVVGAGLSLVGFGAAAVGALALVGWWLAPHRWTKLIVTTRRTIRQEGIVMRKTSEVLHKHVTNVVIEQSLLGRLLNVGYIGLDTAGQGGSADDSGKRSSIEIEVKDIPKPYELKALIDRHRGLA